MSVTTFIYIDTSQGNEGLLPPLQEITSCCLVSTFPVLWFPIYCNNVLWLPFFVCIINFYKHMSFLYMLTYIITTTTA